MSEIDVENKEFLLFSSTDDQGVIKQYKRGTYQYLYKYYDMDTAITCFEKQTLRFCEPGVWADPFEGYFYTAKYNPALPSYPSILACCFTRKKSSESAWKMYSYGKIGLGSKCVQLKIKCKDLLNEVNKYVTYFQSSVYVGQMKYVDENIIRSANNPTSKLNKEIKSWVNAGNSIEALMASLLLLKRNGFSYEEENRYMIVGKKNMNYQGKKRSRTIDIPFSWSNVISEIIIDGNCTKTEENVFLYACHRANINVPIKRSTLYAKLKRQTINI